MSDHFADSNYSVERAKEHIQNLEREIAAFVHSEPYARIVETNADRTEDIYKIRLIKPMPRRLSGIAFDAINNLRAALDQAGHAVATAAGKSGKRAHFPFGDTPAEVHSRIKGKSASSEIPKEVFDVIVALGPYEGGNTLLWALNELCNTQKHEVVIPIVMASGNMKINHYFGNISHAEWPPRWDRSKQEIEIVRVRHGHTPDYNLQIQLFIAIGKVKGVEGQPALGVLNAMIGVVENALVAIKAEARRIGLLT